MAVRIPLYVDADNNLREMSDAQRNAVRNRCRYLYGANPSVTLSRVASSGNISPTMADTRKKAGASSTSVTAAPPETTTAEPGTVTVNYDRISQTTTNTTASADTNNKAFPVYYDGSDIRAMSLTDLYDTFIYPAIDTITGAVGQPGTYRIHTSTTLTGYTAVSTNIVFKDTRANVSAYTAAGIPETLDQPTTVTNYYLLKANNIAAPSMEKMLFIDANANLEQYTNTEIDAILENSIRHVASEVTGSRIRYNINGTGTNLGTQMNDTRLNGDGNHQTRFVSADDYRAQEFPNGTATTINSWRLRVNQT